MKQNSKTLLTKSKKKKRKKYRIFTNIKKKNSFFQKKIFKQQQQQQKQTNQKPKKKKTKKTKQNKTAPQINKFLDRGFVAQVNSFVFLDALLREEGRANEEAKKKNWHCLKIFPE